MGLPALRVETAEALREYGRGGVRIVNMISAAATYLDAGMEQAGEVGCYCLREAFNSLMELEPDESPSIRKAAAEVVSTSQLGGATGEEAHAVSPGGRALFGAGTNSRPVTPWFVVGLKFAESLICLRGLRNSSLARGAVPLVRIRPVSG